MTVLFITNSFSSLTQQAFFTGTADFSIDSCRVGLLATLRRKENVAKANLRIELIKCWGKKVTLFFFNLAK